MLMSWLWTVILGLSVGCALALDRGGALSASIAQGAQSGVTLAIAISGSLCLWTGVGRLMEHAGLTGALSRILSPLLGRIFPSIRTNKPARNYLCANVCANILGLGNAATPMGIQAARSLVDPQRPTVATDELCRLIVLNTASIQLIPANVAAIRAGLGSGSPFDILPAVWITSLCSASLGLLASWIFGRALRRD